MLFSSGTSQRGPTKPAWVNGWFNLFNTENCQQPDPNWKKKSLRMFQHAVIIDDISMDYI